MEALQIIHKKSYFLDRTQILQEIITRIDKGIALNEKASA
jgi:hypothetical protein